jgi:rhodanese-related sulfurtransferase
MPEHLTEALRTNRTGGKTVAQLLDEAAQRIAFMSMAELRARVEAGSGRLVVLDIRERDAYDAGHIPGARHVPRGQLELRIDQTLPDPTVRLVTCCEFGKISTLAADTLRTMGYVRAVALDGGMKGWREAGYPPRSRWSSATRAGAASCIAPAPRGRRYASRAASRSAAAGR